MQMKILKNSYHNTSSGNSKGFTVKRWLQKELYANFGKNFSNKKITKF